MAWTQNDLDIILVSSGLLILVAYHACLVYKTVRHPTTTVIGLNAIHRRAWVREMMQDGNGMKNGIVAVQTIRNSIMASTMLASTAITLCSLVGFLLASSPSLRLDGGHNTTQASTSALSSLKCLLVLVCFLVAFVCHAQCVRFYSHVSYLISTPSMEAVESGDHVEYVSRVFVRGGYFWSVGLRAFYFSIPLFLWNFGAIPMFVASCVVGSVLHFLDTAAGLDPKSG